MKKSFEVKKENFYEVFFEYNYFRKHRGLNIGYTLLFQKLIELMS